MDTKADWYNGIQLDINNTTDSFIYTDQSDKLLAEITEHNSVGKQYLMVFLL